MIERFFRDMRAHSSETASRTDALKPLVYAMGVLLTAAVGFVFGKAPAWLLIVTVILLSVTVVVYIVAFVFCLLSNPDLLRSETYGLQKMAIERGVFGDSQTGLMDPSEEENRVTGPTPLIGTESQNG